MFAPRIDAAAKSLTAVLSRRRALGGPSPRLVALLLGSPARHSASAVSRGLGQPCSTADDCGTDCRHSLPDSNHHCGACGNTCRPDRLCANGVSI